jgi:hypothetical protein
MATENTNIEAIHRTLRETEELKRRSENRLNELEAEASMVRTQIAAYDTVIEQANSALRALFLPKEQARSTIHRTSERMPPPKQTTAPRTSAAAPSRPPAPRPQPVSYYPDEEQIALELEDLEAIEAGTAAQKLNRNTGNIRFNDFRIPQAATIVLREAGEPLHVSEIYQRMAEGGFEFRGQHQLITLAVSLSRAKRFRKTAPGTFELDPRYLAGQVA